MRKFLPLLLLVLAAVGWYTAGSFDQPREFSTDSERAYDLYKQGNLALNAFQWQKAEHFLQEALALDPGFAMAQATLAEVYRAFSSPDTYERATARAESLATLLPDPQERMLVQLRTLRWKEDCRAVSDSLLNSLTEIVPKHPLVLETQAVGAMYLGKHAEAEKVWTTLLEENPNYARAYNWLGYLSANQGNYQKAIGHLRKYGFLAPDLANPHDSMGEILYYIGRYEEAEAEFRAALAKQSDFFISLLNLARVYVAEGRLQKGIELLTQTRAKIAGTKYEKEVDLLLVNSYFAYRLFEPCEQACSYYITTYPEDTRGAYFRALHAAYEGRFDEAQSVADSLFAAIGENKTWQDSEKGKEGLERGRHVFNALLAEMLGQFDLATAEWESVLALAGELAPHHRYLWECSLGENLVRLGRHADAIEVVQGSLALNPNLIRSLAVLGESQVALGRFEEARTTVSHLENILAGADPILPAQATARTLRARLDRSGSS